jgi:SnoaL-like domain
MNNRSLLATVLVLAGVGGCQQVRQPDLAGVGDAIDAYHQAASDADLETYIGLMAPTGVFLGTDASERWTRDEFRAFCEPYFSAGRGWTYVPVERHIDTSTDGRVAWFDEILRNEGYGTLRGSGVLTRSGQDWRVEQYNLTFLVPNEVAEEVVEMIRTQESEIPE